MENLTLTEKSNKKWTIKEDTVFKETTDLRETVRRKFFDVNVMLVLRIINTDCYDLVIFLTLNTRNKQESFIKQSSMISQWPYWIITWSIIGINPIARARRKQPGSTGSYTDFVKLSEWCKKNSLVANMKKKKKKSERDTCMMTKTSIGSLSSHNVRGTKP